MKFHRWLYFHAHWLYKWLSDYAYEFNCQCEELITKIEDAEGIEYGGSK